MSVLPVANNIRNSALPVSNVYYDNSNLTVSAARVLNKEAYRFSFQSLELGTSGTTLTIPKNSLVSHVLVQFRFKFPAANGVPTTAAWPNNSYALPQGWAYSLIRRVIISMGGSQELEIDGRSLFVRNLCEADDDRKKSALMEIAGNSVYVTGTTAAAYGFDPRSSTAGTTSDVYATGCALIYLPFSSINSHRQIPFDAGVLNQNITVRLELNDVSNVFMPMFRDTETTVSPTENMRKLESGQWIVGQQYMIDSSASKRELVGSSGAYSLQYFFYAPQHFTYPLSLPATTGKGKAIQDTAQSVVLQQFKSGSLQSIVLYVNRVTDSKTGFNEVKRAPLNFVELQDLSLEFGGQVVYQAETAQLSRLLDAAINPTDSTYSLEVLNRRAPPPNTNAIQAESIRGNYYRIQLSQFSEIFRDRIQNGVMMSSDSMVCRFKLVDDCDNDAPVNYVFNASYIYQAAVSVARGVGAITYVNPMPSPNLPQQLQINP